jgi:hypothetical protein
MEMRWAGYVAFMWEMRTAYKVLVRKPEARGDLRALAIDGRVMLEWILKKQRLKVFTT